jgi:hypothetical protein
MAVTQIVFTGVPAFVGVVKGPTTVQFFIGEKEFDPANLIEVNLANNPKSIGVSAWARDVECDHPTKGGSTTIGPEFHRDAKHVGCVYLAERIVAKYANVLAHWPPQPDERYQYQLVLRANGEEARYHGFKVEVVSPAVGTLVHVRFFRAGMSTPVGPPQWIDLADPSVCDPQSNGFTTITTASPVGTVGALFVSSGVTVARVPSDPKIPPYQGR